jgi:hypothetical protein
VQPNTVTQKVVGACVLTAPGVLIPRWTTIIVVHGRRMTEFRCLDGYASTAQPTLYLIDAVGSRARTQNVPSKMHNEVFGVCPTAVIPTHLLWSDDGRSLLGLGGILGRLAMLARLMTA